MYIYTHHAFESLLHHRPLVVSRPKSPLHTLASLSSASTASSSSAVGRGHCSGKARCSQRLRRHVAVIVPW